MFSTFNQGLPTENDKITTFADYQRLTRHAQDIDSKQSATLLAIIQLTLTCRSPLSMFSGLSTNGAPFAFRLLLQKPQCSRSHSQMSDSMITPFTFRCNWLSSLTQRFLHFVHTQNTLLPRPAGSASPPRTPPHYHSGDSGRSPEISRRPASYFSCSMLKSDFFASCSA